MADSKKYDGSQWEHSLRKLTTATEAVENPLYSDGIAITAYTIKGNTVQNGTPTPDNPVEVNGVGERTENLVPPDLTRNYMALQGVIDGITYCAASTDGALYVIPASNSETYTIKVHTGDETLSILRCGFIDIATPTVGRQITQAKEIVNAKNPSLTTTNSANKPYFIFQISGLYATEHGLANVMLNTGSTALPYEPYGYKIPISNGQQTTNIYIGDLSLLKSLDGTAVDEISNGTLTRRVDSDGSVLPTPTIEQITMPSIPTIEGANSIIVDTTVQPSEFTATWTGWHDSSVKEWDGSNWD